MRLRPKVRKNSSLGWRRGLFSEAGAPRSTRHFASLLRDFVPSEGVASGRRSRIYPQRLDSRLPVLLRR